MSGLSAGAIVQSGIWMKGLCWKGSTRENAKGPTSQLKLGSREALRSEPRFLIESTPYSLEAGALTKAIAGSCMQDSSPQPSSALSAALPFQQAKEKKLHVQAPHGQQRHQLLYLAAHLSPVVTCSGSEVMTRFAQLAGQTGLLLWPAGFADF